MKKPKAAPRSSARKAKVSPETFTEYLAAVPECARGILIKMHRVIRSSLPKNVTETISYRIPAFRNNRGVLIWLAAFKDHCSLFPTASVIAAFKNELKDFSTSKGTIHFPLDKPLPATLIRKLVKARLAHAEIKKRSNLDRRPTVL